MTYQFIIKIYLKSSRFSEYNAYVLSGGKMKNNVNLFPLCKVAIQWTHKYLYINAQSIYGSVKKSYKISK